MSRVERYREIRICKRKFKFSFLIFFILVIPGLCIADYSVNSVMKNESRVELVSVEKEAKSLYSLSFFNYKLHINTEYVEKDFHTVKDAINRIMGYK